ASENHDGRSWILRIVPSLVPLCTASLPCDTSSHHAGLEPLCGEGILLRNRTCPRCRCRCGRGDSQLAAHRARVYEEGDGRSNAAGARRELAQRMLPVWPSE